jgi:hypothetical protein
MAAHQGTSFDKLYREVEKVTSTADAIAYPGLHGWAMLSETRVPPDVFAKPSAPRPSPFSRQISLPADRGEWTGGVAGAEACRGDESAVAQVRRHPARGTAVVGRGRVPPRIDVETRHGYRAPRGSARPGLD